MRSPLVLSSPGWKDLTPSRFPHSPLIIFTDLLGTLFSLPVPFWIVGARTGHGTPCAAWQALSRVGRTHFYRLLKPLGMQPRIWFSFIAAEVCCWLTFRDMKHISLCLSANFSHLSFHSHCKTIFSIPPTICNQLPFSTITPEPWRAVSGYGLGWGVWKRIVLSLIPTFSWSSRVTLQVPFHLIIWLLASGPHSCVKWPET